MLEDFDAAYLATAFARRGDVVVFGDFTSDDPSGEGVVPPGILASGEVTLTSRTFAAGRRLDAGGGAIVDLMGGVRGWQLNGLVAVPPAGVRLAREKSFVDPVVALRVNAAIAADWSAITYAEVGGFGVGSDFTWQAEVTATCRATDTLLLSFGYRRLHLDYSAGGTAFEGALGGPVIGRTLRF